MINRLHIKNFTVFNDVVFEFVPGINVLVGANATGKTHVMKLLYTIQKAQMEWRANPTQSCGQAIGDSLLSVFQFERLIDLARNQSEVKLFNVTARWNDRRVMVSQLYPSLTASGEWDDVTTPVYIPVKDMLAHSVGFLSLYDQRYIDFDATHRDILSLAFTPTLKQSAMGDIGPLLDLLAERMGGRVEVRGERFYLTGERGRFEMHLVAEGWRKLALLYQLIANGSLGNGRVLYWDEPETNLNPTLMDEVIGVLLELARRGTQVFLATHDYIILKELELQKQEQDSLRMFAMERSKEDGSVTVKPAASYDELVPNLIEEQFERIYDLEVDRALRG